MYQKCAIYNATSGGGHEVRYTHDQSDTHKPQALDCDVTGPNTTLTSTDVRRAILKHSRAAANSSVDRALRALDVRVVPLIEPGRGYPTGPRGRANMCYSTDEAGAYLHHIARSYDDLADGTFFVHGHVHGGYDAAVRTMDWTAASGVAPQTYFGTTRDTDTRVQRGMPVALGVSVNDAMRKPRGGNYRNGEFYASRLSIRRRPRSWFAQAFEIVDRDARCADVYNRIPRPSLPAPFEGRVAAGEAISAAAAPEEVRRAVASLMQLLHRAQRDFRSAQGPDKAVVARLREDLEIARGKLAALDPDATLQDLKSFKDAKALLRKTMPPAQ